MKIIAKGIAAVDVEFFVSVMIMTPTKGSSFLYLSTLKNEKNVGKMLIYDIYKVITRYITKSYSPALNPVTYHWILCR